MENEERKKKVREYMRDYQKTEKYKESRRKYLQTNSGKMAVSRAMKKYFSSPKGKSKAKENHKKYIQTPWGKDVQRRIMRRYYEKKIKPKKLNLSEEEFKSLTKRCELCGFDKIVEIDYRDGNQKNTSKDNLVGHCPNCKRMKFLKKSP